MLPLHFLCIFYSLIVVIYSKTLAIRIVAGTSWGQTFSVYICLICEMINKKLIYLNMWVICNLKAVCFMLIGKKDLKQYLLSIIYTYLLNIIFVRNFYYFLKYCDFMILSAQASWRKFIIKKIG